MIKNQSTFWFTTLFTAWSIDFLFWGKIPGVSFTLFIFLVLAGLWYLSRHEKITPHPTAHWLTAGIFLFAFLAAFREEPFTRVLNYLAALSLLGILLLTYQGGRWAHFTLSDYVIRSLKLFLDMIGLPIQLLTNPPDHDQGQPAKDKNNSSQRKFIFALLRGLLLAIPVLAVLGGLMSAADPIFGDWLSGLITFFNLEELPQYILRGCLIALWTFLLAGLFLHALLKSKPEKLVSEGDHWPPQLLGFTEAAVVLGGVNLLFFAFVVIQFRYFFGGEKNISLQGYTYAEYARRGFAELLAVAFFTLLIFIVLSSITKRTTNRAKQGFTALTVPLTILMGVILASSFQRLTLYESAYGFTRLRTYAHLCILWIGILFLGILILEITRRWNYFTLASLLAVLGFILNLNVINVDGFITHRNLNRAAAGSPLDVDYLKTLSLDATNSLIKGTSHEELNTEQKAGLQGILACKSTYLRRQSLPWQSTTWSRYHAEKTLEDLQNLQENYPTFRKKEDWFVVTENGIQSCDWGFGNQDF